MIIPADQAAFVETYGHLFEHSPWVVARAWARRPFNHAGELHAAFIQVLRDAGATAQLGLFRAHPELGLAEAKLTEASEAEQAGAGLKHLSPDDYAKFSEMNARYRETFGFPFIICVRLHTKGSILKSFERRLKNDLETEHAMAFTEVAVITAMRLLDMGDFR